MSNNTDDRDTATPLDWLEGVITGLVLGGLLFVAIPLAHWWACYVR